MPMSLGGDSGRKAAAMGVHGLLCTVRVYRSLVEVDPSKVECVWWRTGQPRLRLRPMLRRHMRVCVVAVSVGCCC